MGLVQNDQKSLRTKEALPSSPVDGESVYLQSTGKSWTWNHTLSLWLGAEYKLLDRTDGNGYFNGFPLKAARTRLKNVSGIYISRWEVVTKGIDLNNATNSYSILLGVTTFAGDAVALKSFDTHLDTVNVWTSRTYHPVDFVINPLIPASKDYIYINVDVEDGSPEGLDIITTVFAQDVIAP